MNTSQYDACIIGAGISGLAVAHFLRDQQPDINLLVLEQSNRPGGTISSYSKEGYLAEWGPHGFLDNCPESRELINLAGLADEVETAPLAKFVRYICLNGSLNCIPQTPLKIIRQPLMPFTAKLGVLGDLFQKPLHGEPSVASWVEHRFGKALLPFADAVFTGTYAGDIARLKIDAVMPGVRALEHTHGSVIRGVIAKLRSSSKGNTGKKKQLPAMTSFQSGMGRLPQGLAARLEADDLLRYNSRVHEISREQSGWRLVTDHEEFSCRQLVMALPINRGMQLLRPISRQQPAPLHRVPEARIASVMLGFTSTAEIPFGFGYLAPEREQRFTLGALFSSHMFPGRAPSGHQLVEALVGGRRHEERLELDNNAIAEQVFRDLRQLMHLPDAPVFTQMLRPSSGIPQLEEGYTRLLRWREEIQGRHTGLHICGFGWKGIGINDMIKEAGKIAANIITKQSGREEAEVKGVYF